MRYLPVLLLLIGCGEEATPTDTTLPLRPITLSVLYYPGPGIDTQVAEAGAEKLLRLGVEALPTDDLTEAQMRLRFIACTSPQHEADPYLAITYPCGDIEICAQYDQEPFTYAHEMGHALGMRHIDKPGVMYPRLNTVQEFTTNDWQEWLNRRQEGSVSDPACADHWKNPVRRLM
jgi:hypothetical protein